MFAQGFGIVPISVLIWLGHFKSLGVKRQARRPRRMKYPYGWGASDGAL
jgi:hypothetical protein